MYESSLKQKWDYQNGIDYAVKTAENKAQERIAKSLKDNNLSLGIISQSTGLSIEEIKKL